MMKKMLTHAVICMTPWALGACEKELISDEPVMTESSVSIITRSVTAEETISFPVNVYVFNAESKEFVMHKKISEENEPLGFSLPFGSYSLYAVGGAEDNRYIVPDGEGVTEESEITLKEGKEHADLMTAYNTIELKDNEEYDLTLNIERQVVQLSNAIIKDVPEDITNISISLATIYKGIKINGELGTEWTQHYPLTNNGDGEWSLPVPVMLLLKSEPVNINISMIKDDGTIKNYTYVCPDELIKNYQINITAFYQENNSVNIVGHITGSSWAGTKDITFTFGDNNDDNNEGDNEHDDNFINEVTPNEQSFYKECYVLKVENNNDYNEVLLLYKEDFKIDPKNKSEEVVLQEIYNHLSSLSINGISGWRLPNANEADIIINEYPEIRKAGIRMDAGGYFYYKDNNALKIFINNGKLHQTFEGGNRYIPVVTLKFKK